MVITQQNLQLFFTAFEQRFWTAYDLVALVHDRIATTFPVTTEQWLSAWLTMVDKYREWVGPRIARTPAPVTYLVFIKNFELTETISRYRLEDDTHGIYAPLPAMMAMQARKWPDYQIRDLMQAQGSYVGNTYQNGFDGLSFWNTAHPNDFWDASKGTFPNDYTGGGQTVNGILVGGALAPNSFATVCEDMGRRKNESGEAWGIKPGLSIGSLMTKVAFMSILQAQFMGMPVIGQIGTGNFPTAGAPSPANSPLIGATDNMLKSWTDLLVWEDLGGSATVGGGSLDQVWYVEDVSKPIKAFAWLLRQAPNFIARTRLDDPLVFDQAQFAFGSDARGAPAWTFPQLASRSGA